MEFLCSKSSSRLKALLILTCSCQVCDKLHTHIRGRVLSSLNRSPIVLAAIMIDTEVATFTDQQGYFSFDLSTGNGDITLLFQETQHRPLEVSINIRHSKSPEINLVMEYIEGSQHMEKAHLGMDIVLKDEGKKGDKISLSINPNSLVSQGSLDLYEGSGQFMYSLYSSNKRPNFTSEALSQMIYTDSNGAVFSIHSYVVCSMDIVGESGRHLSLRLGYSVTLKLALKFDMNIDASDINGLHLFVYSKAKSRWMDKGRVGVMSIQKDGDYASFAALQIALHELNTLWVIGLPVRVSCYIKAMVTNALSRKGLSQVTVSLTQSDTSLRRPTFYQYLLATSPGSEGVCLRAVCSMGGVVRVVSSESDKVTAVPPDVDVGMVMGDREQIMFYDTGKEWTAQTPFYHTEKECEAATKHYLEFNSNRSVVSTFSQPTMLPLIGHEKNTAPSQSNPKEHCFVKVSVYDCASLTDIKVLSYASPSHKTLLSINTAVAVGTASSLNTCQTSEVVSLRASCVEFTCHSDVHVTVQSQNHYDPYSQTPGQVIDCRYWSSNRNLQESKHPSKNMKSFHLSDFEGLSPASGVYRSTSANLALLQCMSGRQDAPGNSIDPETGVAVTFTCLF